MPTGQKVSALLVVAAAVLGLAYTVIAGNEPLLGLDLQGGVSVVLEPTGATGGQSREVTDESLDLTVELLRARIDEIGVAEPEISRQGENIVVGLPGLVEDQEEALARLRQTAELRFRPVLVPLGPALDAGSTSDPVPTDETEGESTTSTTAPDDTTSESTDSTAVDEESLDGSVPCSPNRRPIPPTPHRRPRPRRRPGRATPTHRPRPAPPTEPTTPRRTPRPPMPRPSSASWRIAWRVRRRRMRTTSSTTTSSSPISTASGTASVRRSSTTRS